MGPQISGLLITTALLYRLLAIRICKIIKIWAHNKAGVKSTVLQNCTGKKNTPWQTKPHQKLMEHKMCLAICILTKPQLGKVVFFYQYCYKVAAVWLTHCCCIVILVVNVGIIFDYIFLWKHVQGYKSWGPKVLAFLSLQ